jgi:NhaA family Na+:H+ antiporter
MHSSYVDKFFKKDYAVSVLLFACTFFALILVNSPLGKYYNAFLNTPVELTIGPIELHKDVLLWINDGLMGLFFLNVGLEIKKEVLIGELRSIKNIMLPVLGAIGGIVVPALIFYGFTHNDPVALKGWAIPAATDIAFAVGVISILGKRVPSSLKTFLLTLAIVDDLGAILIIAFFYTAKISLFSLAVALGCFVGLLILNLLHIRKLFWYSILGLCMWVALLKSGIHATLAGVLIAMTIPQEVKCKDKNQTEKKSYSPLASLTSILHDKVNYFVLPLFAFTNSGVVFKDLDANDLSSPITLGIIAALFFGKQLGVFLFSYIGTKLKITKLPENTTWLQLYGAAILCGIGFTMSLFISSLAFEGSLSHIIDANRVGILIGSMLSAIAGVFVLKLASNKPKVSCLKDISLNISSKDM